MLFQGLSSGDYTTCEVSESKAVLPLLGVPADEYPMSLPGSAVPWIHTITLSNIRQPYAITCIVYTGAKLPNSHNHY